MNTAVKEMTQKINMENTLVIWQDNEEGVIQHAIVLEPYNDCISISQNGHDIDLYYENVDEFCKALKQLKKNKR